MSFSHSYLFLLNRSRIRAVEQWQLDPDMFSLQGVSNCSIAVTHQENQSVFCVQKPLLQIKDGLIFYLFNVVLQMKKTKTLFQH